MTTEIRVKVEVHLDEADQFDIPTPGGHGNTEKMRVRLIAFEPGLPNDVVTLYASGVTSTGSVHANARPLMNRHIRVIPEPILARMRAVKVTM